MAGTVNNFDSVRTGRSWDIFNQISTRRGFGDDWNRGIWISTLIVNNYFKVGDTTASGVDFEISFDVDDITRRLDTRSFSDYLVWDGRGIL